MHAFPATNLARGFLLKASGGGKRTEAHHGVVFAAPLMTTIAELRSSLAGAKHVAGAGRSLRAGRAVSRWW
jgi:hypothetical protein